MPQFSIQETTLILFALSILLLAAAGAWRIVRDNKTASDASVTAAIDMRESMRFLQALKEQVGTDHGSTLQQQLLALRDAVEKARVITEQKVRDDLVITEANRKAVTEFGAVALELRQMVGQVRRDMEQYQRYNELLAKTLSERGIAATVRIDGDAVGRDKST